MTDAQTDDHQTQHAANFATFNGHDVTEWENLRYFGTSANSA